MRAGFVIAGAGMMLLGMLGLAGVIQLLSRYLPDGAMIVVMAAGGILVIASLLPPKAKERQAGEDFRNMKRCHGCGKMVPPDTIRCPNCGAKFTSLYDNL